MTVLEGPMNHTARLVAATALTLPLLLAGCSGGDSEGAPSPTGSASTPAASASSPSTKSSDSSSASTTSSSSSSATSSATTSSSKTSDSSSASSSGASTSSTTKKLDAKLVSSCVSASTKINGAIGQWNVAVRSGSSDQRSTAARRLGSTAGELRTLASASKHQQFSSRTRAVASDLDKMKKAHDGKKSVNSDDLNSDYRKLRTWCTDQIKP